MPFGFPPTSVYPSDYDDNSTLYLVYNTSETVLALNNQSWSDEIEIEPVAADADEIWADNGFINITGELIYYDLVEKDANGKVFKFKRCLRNMGGTATKYNPRGTPVRGFVIAEHHNQLVDAIINIEEFVGAMQSSDQDTLDWRIRNLQNTPIVYDDFGCPDINFMIRTVEDNPASGTLISYTIEIQGNIDDFTLNFGDGFSTKSTQDGTHRYAPSSKIDPLIEASNGDCSIIQTPIERNELSEPKFGATVSELNLVLPDLPSMPPISINISESVFDLQLPPLNLGCIDLSPLDQLSSFFMDINIDGTIPSVIEINDTIPSVISITPVDIPSLISITPVDIPSTINFGPVDIPSQISISDNLPSSIEVNSNLPTSIPITGAVDIPSVIVVVGDIPTTITVNSNIPNTITLEGSIPSMIHIESPSFDTVHFEQFSFNTVEFGETPSFGEITFGEAPSFGEITFGEAPSFEEITFGAAPEISVNWGTPPVCSCVVTCPTSGGTSFTNYNYLQEDYDSSIPVDYTFTGIPSEISIVPPDLTKFREAMQMPKSIAIDFPEDMSIKLQIPDQAIKLDLNSDDLPSINLVALDIPKSIAIDATNVPLSIELDSSNLPSVITLDSSSVPSEIKVVGIPESISIVHDIPEFIKVKMPDDPFISVSPISVTVQLEMQKIVGTDQDDLQCVAIVPCNR